MDCGHAIVCANCAEFIGSTCPLCKNNIDFKIVSTPEEISESRRSRLYTPESCNSTNRKTQNVESLRSDVGTLRSQMFQKKDYPIKQYDKSNI